MRHTTSLLLLSFLCFPLSSEMEMIGNQEKERGGEGEKEREKKGKKEIQMWV
jgi:hypothetical protein